MGNSDSRTLFRDQVQQLVNSHLTAESFDTWSGLFVFPESAEDVLAMFPASDVRMLISDHPWNIRLVIDKGLEIMEGLKDAESSYALDDFKHTANAARVLSRIIPVTLEPQIYDFYRTWWSADRRGIRLLNAALSLITESTKSPALANKPELPVEGKIDGLRLILTTLSEALYRQRNERDLRAELWHWVLASSALPLSEGFLMQTLHSAFEYSPPALGWLPYTSRLKSEKAECLSMISLHVLIALLFYEFPEKRLVDALLVGTDECAQACRDMLESREIVAGNTVVISLASIGDPDTLEMVTTGIVRVLCNFREAKNTYLPGALKTAITHVEVLFFAYFMLVENDFFLRYFAKSAVKIVVPIFELLEEKRQEEESGGILCAGIIVLLKLTTSREFCMALNTPCVESMPTPWPIFTGSLGDAFVIGACHLLQTCPSHNLWLTRYLTRALANFSPYAHDLSMVAALRVTTLLASYCLKGWLFSSPRSYEATANLMEFCNSQIQYKWDNASALVFALLGKAEIIARVMKMSAPEGAELPEGVGWKATEGWLTRIKAQLPVTTLVVMFERLIPQLEALCVEKQSRDESDALKFIQDTTLVGLLPVPHPLQVGDYKSSSLVSSAVFWSFWVTVWEKHKSLFDEKGVQMFAAQDTE